MRKSNPPRTPPPERTTGRFPRPRNRTVDAAPRARGTNPVPTDLETRTTSEVPALDPSFRRRRAPAPVGATRELVRPNRLFRRLVTATGLDELTAIGLFEAALARQDATPATLDAAQALELEAELRSLTMNHLPAGERVAASGRLDELFASLR